MNEVLFTSRRLRAVLGNLPVPARYLVAYSGGADSHVLLHALSMIAHEQPLPVLAAVHVNHVLHPEADRWQAHCEEVCRALGVALHILRVDARAPPGESPEAAARAARYAVLATLVGADDMLLTAHHRDDQAETLLLQLLRGAGPRGLAGMPRCARFGGGYLARPLLGFPRAAVRAWAEGQGLRWVEDSSNRDLRYERNFLRREVLPRLRERWPGVDRTLARTARHQAAAAALAEELAIMDLTALLGPSPDTLLCRALRALGADRQRLVVRAWLRRLGLPPPAAVHVRRILREALPAQRDRSPLVHWQGAEVRRFGDLLYAMRPLPPHDPRRVLAWDMRTPLELAGGRLQACAVVGAGIDLRRCTDARVEIRFRRGGERCRPAGDAHTRTLKQLLQVWGVPPWRRDRVPLIYVDGELAAVAGVCVCEPFRAAADAPGLLPRWREASPLREGSSTRPD